MVCQNCGIQHITADRGSCSYAWNRDRKERQLATNPVANTVANTQLVANMVVIKPELVANTAQMVANSVVANKHGQYADKEKRKVYQRDLMRRRRAKS